MRDKDEQANVECVTVAYLENYLQLARMKPASKGKICLSQGREWIENR